MKGFNEKHIKDLREADGFVLQDVRGETVAIGLDSEYPDVASFLADYINQWNIWSLALRLNYDSPTKMLNDLFSITMHSPVPMARIETKLMGGFNGISADDYAKKLEEKKWHLGDILEDDGGHKAMIVKDHLYNYVLMNVNPKDKDAFKLSLNYDWADKLNELQDNNPEWHKVNAKLVIE